MKLIGLVGYFLLLRWTAESSLLDPVIENVRHIKATHPPDKVSGMWKKKMLWKPRWVKEWKSSNVLKPVWKKFWGPVIIREWVPIPKPPPQWDGLHVGPAEPPGASFLDVGEPPAPNLSYLPKSPASTKHVPQGSFSGGSQTPHLPITTGFRSQAETYSGHPSYATNLDSSAYDLNPPVEQFNSYYSYTTPSTHHAPTLLPVKPSIPHSHSHHNHKHHHHHHHHRVKSNGHTHPSHSPDLTKFPPDWNSWDSVVRKPASGLAQASSAVSIVSSVHSTTTSPNVAFSEHPLPEGLSPVNDGFIQQAALVSEFHYTEHPIPSATSSLVNFAAGSHGANRTESHTVHGHFGGSPHVLPPRPAPIQPATSTPHRPPQTSTVKHEHPPQPSHLPKLAVAHVPPSIHSQPPSSAPPVGPRPNHIKSASSGHLDGPNPVAPHRPPSVQPNAPIVTRPQASVSGSVRGPAPGQHTSTSQASLNQKIPVDPRKPTAGTAPVPSNHINTVHIHATQPPPNKKIPVDPRKPTAGMPPVPHPRQNPPNKKNAPKSEPPKDKKVHVNKPKVPDFKALPSTSVEAFHFIEGFPSNQTLTKAALIGNINQVEISGAKSQQKEVNPQVAELVQAIIHEHSKQNSVATTEQTTTEAPTERATVTIVYPSTNPFVRKTLKDYLAEENSAEKSMKVFVVTPVPYNVESST